MNETLSTTPGLRIDSKDWTGKRILRYCLDLQEGLEKESK